MAEENPMQQGLQAATNASSGADNGSAASSAEENQTQQTDQQTERNPMQEGLEAEMPGSTGADADQGQGEDSSYDKVGETFLSQVHTYTGEPGRAVSHAVTEGVSQAADTTTDIVNWIAGDDVAPDEPLSGIVTKEPETAAGQIGAELGKLAMGMVGINKFAKFPQLASKLTKSEKAGDLVGNMASGGVADFTLVDEEEGRLADLLDQYPILKDSVGRLAHEPDDTDLESRAKNTLEGLGLGLIADTAVKGVKAFGKLRRGDEPSTQTAGEIKQAAKRDQQKSAQASDDTTQQGDPEVEKADELAQRAREGDQEAAQEARQMAEDRMTGGQATDAGQQANPEADVDAERAAQEEVDLRKVMSKKDIDKFKEAIGRIHTGDDPEMAMSEVNLNLDKLPTDHDTKDVIAKLSRIADQKLSEFKGGKGKRSDVVVQEMADALGTKPGSLMNALDQTFKGVQNSDAVLTAAYAYHDRLAKEASRLAQTSLVSDDEKIVEQANEVIQRLANFQGLLGGTETEMGRAFRSLGTLKKNMPDIQSLAADPEAAKKGALSGQEAKRALRRIAMAEGDLKATTQQASGKAGSSWDKFNYFILNNMLSGIDTQLTQVGSSAMQSVQRPIEMMVGGALGGSKARAREGADLLFGEFASSLEGVKMAAKAFRQDKNILDPHVSPYDVQHSAGEMRPTSDNKFVDKLFQMHGLPTRMLMTTDEFFKQMNYRSRVRAMALRQGRAQGLKGKRLKEYTKRYMDASYGPQGEAIVPQAKEYGRETTFTSDLQYGPGKTIQDFVQKHPWARILGMPFTRTPVNIFRHMAQRGPLGSGFAQRQMKADLKAGGDRARDAIGKQVVGNGLWGAGAFLAFNERITGAGPKDPEQWKQWRMHNQPYSLKIPWGTNEDGSQRYEFISYRRADPLGTFAGIPADSKEGIERALNEVLNREPAMRATLEQMGDAGEMSRDGLSVNDLTEAGTAIAAGIAKNVTSKTYLQGMTELLAGVASGKPYEMKKLVQNKLGTLAPWQMSAFTTSLNDEDAVMRESRNVLDGLWAKVPGWSDNRPASRNMLGEKVMRPRGLMNRTIWPYTAESGEDRVGQELAKLAEEDKVIAPPKETMLEGDIDLTDPKWKNSEGDLSPYDYLMKEVGEMNLREKFKRRMEASDWDTLGPEAKQVELNKIQNRVTKRAERKMLRKYERLNSFYRRLKHNKDISQQPGGQAVLEEIANESN